MKAMKPTYDDAVKIMAVPKRLLAGAKFEWISRTNHFGHSTISHQFEDEDGAIIPGLKLILERKRPIVADRCQMEMGLFQLLNGVQVRIYQLNVSPRDKKSHTDETQIIYGPHEHIGSAVRPVANADVCCGSFEPAFDLYCLRINLAFSGSKEFLL